MFETAIGDGTILAGLFWVLLALAGLALAVAVAFVLVLSAWRGWDVLAAAGDAWNRVRGAWQAIAERFR